MGQIKIEKNVGGIEGLCVMGRRAKKRVAEEYTLDKVCGQYEDVFVGENQ